MNADDDRRVKEPARARISAGKIPLRDFLRCLSYLTDKTVVFPSARRDASFADSVELEVLDAVDPATEDLLRAFLTANGYVVTDRELRDGTPIIFVRHRRDESLVDPAEPTPILTVKDLESGRDYRAIGASRAKPRNATSTLPRIIRRLQSITGSPVSGVRMEGNLTVDGEIPESVDELTAILRLAGFAVWERIHASGEREFRVAAVRGVRPTGAPITIVRLKNLDAVAAIDQLRAMLALTPESGSDGLGERRRSIGSFNLEFIGNRAIALRAPRPCLTALRSVLADLDAGAESK